MHNIAPLLHQPIVRLQGIILRKAITLLQDTPAEPTGDLPVKRMFVRDSRQAWYHRGIRGHGDTFMSLAESLGELLGCYEVERLVMTGMSSARRPTLLRCQAWGFEHEERSLIRLGTFE